MIGVKGSRDKRMIWGCLNHINQLLRENVERPSKISIRNKMHIDVCSIKESFLYCMQCLKLTQISLENYKKYFIKNTFKKNEDVASFK